MHRSRHWIFEWDSVKQNAKGRQGEQGKASYVAENTDGIINFDIKRE